MSHTEHPHELLEYLARRDFDGLTSMFAAGATARFLLPRGPEEQRGGPEIIGRFQDWFAAAPSFEMTSSASERIGDRQRLSWQLRLERGGGFPETIQQVAFLDGGPAGIQHLDLLCSGFHPLATEPDLPEPAVFDAGDLGCGDGLAQESRRRISAVPVGASVKVVAADPAAKEDLPPPDRRPSLSSTPTSTGDDAMVCSSALR